MRGILFNKCPSAPIIAFFHFTLLSSVSFYLVISFRAVYSSIGRVWILEKPITGFGCLFLFSSFSVCFTQGKNLEPINLHPSPYTWENSWSTLVSGPFGPLTFSFSFLVGRQFRSITFTFDDSSLPLD